MESDAASRWRDRTAILGSIAIHLCVLAALVALPRVAPFPSEEPDEHALLAGIIRIERSPPAPPIAHPIVAKPTRAPAVLAPPRLNVAVTKQHAKRPLVVAPENAYVPPPTPKPKRRPKPSPVPTAQRIAIAPAPVASAEATLVPTATPPPAATPVAAERDSGIGNFGESYPARPMPGMVEELRTKITGHAFVRVSVDERGHATGVVIVSGIDDPALRAEVTRELLAAMYIPASCNGLGCAATVELRT